MLSAIADMTQEAEGAESLARDTGGFTVAKTNDLETGIVRIGRESRSYYLLGYAPGDIPRDGRFRKIEVRCAGPGAIVRARRGYFAPSDAADAGAAKATSRDGPPDPVRPRRSHAARRDPAAPDHLRARGRRAWAGRACWSRPTPTSPGSSSRETERASCWAPSTRSRWPPAGRTRTSSATTRRSTSSASPARSPSPSWYTIVREFELPAGGYQAKLVVRDATSRRLGTVSLEFEVPPARRAADLEPDPHRHRPGRPRRRAERRPAGPAHLQHASKPFFCRFDVLRGRDRPGHAHAAGPGRPRPAAAPTAAW